LVSAPSPQISQHLNGAAGSLPARSGNAVSTGWLHLIREGRVVPGQLILTLDRSAPSAALAIKPAAIAEVALSIEAPFQLRRRGAEARIVTGLERSSVDRVRCRSVARAMAWIDQVRAGMSIAAIARIENVSERFIRARLLLALLSPQIVAAIEQGRQPASLSTELLVRTPCHPTGTSKPACSALRALSHFPLSTIRLPARP
jgi:site-specific DNA recombinase